MRHRHPRRSAAGGRRRDRPTRGRAGRHGGDRRRAGELHAGAALPSAGLARAAHRAARLRAGLVAADAVAGAAVHRGLPRLRRRGPRRRTLGLGTPRSPVPSGSAASTSPMRSSPPTSSPPRCWPRSASPSRWATRPTSPSNTAAPSMSLSWHRWRCSGAARAAGSAMADAVLALHDLAAGYGGHAHRRRRVARHRARRGPGPAGRQRGRKVHPGQGHHGAASTDGGPDRDRRDRSRAGAQACQEAVRPRRRRIRSARRVDRRAIYRDGRLHPRLSGRRVALPRPDRAPRARSLDRPADRALFARHPGQGWPSRVRCSACRRC